MSITYILSGFAVGLLVGMTGVGGGSLMTPLLTLLFGVTPVGGGRHRPRLRVASPRCAGTATHRSRGDRAAGISSSRLCIGALPAALVATLALQHFGR